MIAWAGIAGDDLVTHWPTIAELVRGALERTGADADFTDQDILKACLEGSMQCWIAHDDGDILVAAITEILVYPRRKVLGVPYVGAKKHTIRYWKQFIGLLERYAKTNGCTAWRGGGRRGWVKMLKPDRDWVQFEMNIGD